MNTVEELEHVTCSLCGSKDYINTYISKDYLFSQETFTVVRCKACGLLFTNPRVKETQIGGYYYPGYLTFNNSKQVGVFQKIKNKVGRLFGSIHWEVLQTLESTNVKTVLEIGPGNGSLLYFLKEHGFEVVGIETDSHCAQKIQEQGIACHCGDLNDVISNIGAKKFDAVILCHAFEHVYHPKKTLKNIYDLLNENGVVYLSLPNSGSREAKLFGKHWKGLDLPRHIVHYDTNTIRLILQGAGFDVIKIENQGFPSSFVESIGFRFFKKRKMPNKVYAFVYYPWKILSPIHLRLFGSGIMKVLSFKKNV
ncbi:MAG: class I SAM-dependent methyltransferase [Proteobacteria bacterium]|nr:class I SAM-dependent methyltransferase [Pseudomonadota bacterium]